MNLKKYLVFLPIILLFSACSLLKVDREKTLKTRIVDILAQMPADNSSERNRLASELLLLGPAGLLETCEMLVPPGAGDDSKVRYALDGLSMYVNRPIAEAERLVYATVLKDALYSFSNTEVKTFLIQQLQLVGKNESVPTLNQFLQDDSLCDPATRALLTIGTTEAEAALLTALPLVTDANRITIIKALGELRSKAAVTKILQYANHNDFNLRSVSLYALANIGDSTAAPVMVKALQAKSSFDKSKAISLYLLFAHRLADSGNRQKCVEICRNLIKTYTSPAESNIRSAALTTLVNVEGVGALNDMLAAMNDASKDYRTTALKLNQVIQDRSATEKWIDRMENLTPEIKAEIIEMLGSRGDKTAVPVVLQSLKEKDLVVRMAAISAMAHLDETMALPALLEALASEQPDEINTIKETLLRFSVDQLIPAIATVLPGLPAYSRAALLDILAQRKANNQVDIVFNQTKDENDSVRVAAIQALAVLAEAKDLPALVDILHQAETNAEINAAQTAVIAVAGQITDPAKRDQPLLELLRKTSGAKRSKLLYPLARIGGQRALDLVIAETKSSNPELQESAIRALADWCDFAATTALLHISSLTNKDELRLLTLQGYVRLVESANLPADSAFTMLTDAMRIARSTEDQKLILAGLSKVRTITSLNFVAKYFEDKALQSEAALTAVSIALPPTGTSRGLTGNEVINQLNRVIDIIEDDYERERVKKYVEQVSTPEGFVSLVNGKDLTGWKGLVADPPARAKMSPDELARAQTKADEEMQAHWQVVDGILKFDGAGHSLCTAKDYRDFELWVDWKIHKDGDSGIYLRGTPQVQIWDPAQHPEGSGGLYNNQKGANKPLVLADNPVGEWNTFRIKMIDERVTVHLNEVLVVDNIIMENYWERDKPIYPAGQIELQAHNTPLYFRNIFIREINDMGGAVDLTEQEKADGFVSLFNGTDLTGWRGNTRGYVAENGKIVLYPKRGDGNLYTEKEYRDFIFRFEFTLTPGANNGLGIRAPLTGDAAYQGLELQIMDNTAHIYKDLKPYQYHGSIYGVFPAERGHLKPVGEWNYQEVVARGRQITVNLNGVTILEVNIDEISAAGTMDGKKHPGLKRQQGHIGFLGHGSVVEFRKIRIKELK